MMKQLILLLTAACLSTSAAAQENYELGKPGDDNYRYLDEYKALKTYIDYEKYPNFKLGGGTTVNEYLSKPVYRNMINSNFTETVAGNAMKMASCVDGNGSMNFSTVKKYVKTATDAGLNVYGHTLAWHSQQANGWLLKLLADRPDPTAEVEFAEIASKDFRKQQNIGWHSDEAQYGYSVKYDKNDGLIVHCSKKNTNSWDVQFLAMENIALEVGKTYKMTMTVKGSTAGNLHSKLGDWNNGQYPNIPFTTEWKDVEVSYKAIVANNFFMLQCGDFVGDIYIKNIKIEGDKRKSIPLTAEERHDTLVWAMDKWIKGMMEACEGKVKAWDLVNEAIAGDGNDGQGNYELQHSEGYKSGTWDVGGSAFYWQDYMGDLEYVRQACRLARKYGPEDVKLFINDYNLESDWDNNKKVRSLVGWIKKWEADGVTRIDGIGTQMHISCFEDDKILNNIKKHITQMFQIMANSGKLVRVSEMDMGYVRGTNNRWGSSVKTADMTEAEHKKMADFYEWIVTEYFRLIPPEQQWGICQWCTTDSPANSGWRGGEPVGIWDQNLYRKHSYAGWVRALNGGEPTAVQSIAADKAVDTSKGIFTLSGLRLSATSLDELPSGLYIVDGKKVVK